MATATQGNPAAATGTPPDQFLNYVTPNGASGTTYSAPFTHVTPPVVTGTPPGGPFTPNPGVNHADNTFTTPAVTQPTFTPAVSQPAAPSLPVPPNWAGFQPGTYGGGFPTWGQSVPQGATPVSMPPQDTTTTAAANSHVMQSSNPFAPFFNPYPGFYPGFGPFPPFPFANSQFAGNMGNPLQNGQQLAILPDASDLPQPAGVANKSSVAYKLIPLMYMSLCYLP